MPVEVALLAAEAVQFGRCPRCDEPFYPFMRGEVQRSARPWWLFGRRRDYCALICRACKDIVGWESPAQGDIPAVAGGAANALGGAGVGGAGPRRRGDLSSQTDLM